MGPGKVTHGGHTFYSKGAAAVPVELDTFDVGTAAHGPLDKRLLDFSARVVVVPDGAWTAAARAALFPYATTRPGDSLGAGDPDLVIHCINQERYTAECAILTKIPSLFLGAKETMIGEAEYTLLRKDNVALTAADSLIKRETGQAYVDSPLTVASIKTQPYTGAWGAVTGFTNIETEDGWTIDFDLTVEPVKSDAVGRLDLRFQSLMIRASCVPLNVDPDNIEAKLHYQDAGALLRGGSLQAKGAALTITGADAATSFTMANAVLVRGGYRFGSNTLRQDALTWVSTRTLTAGAPDALFTLA